MTIQLYTFPLHWRCVLGHHQTRYGEFRAYHFGRLNIENTVKYLVSQSIVSLDQLEEFRLYGSSAGAIGALFHKNNCTYG